MDPHAYCAERAAPVGSSLHYALRAAPPAARRAMLAVHAFRRELEEALTECRDPAVARARLGWWREEISTLRHGVPRHPVARALAWAAGQHPLPLEPLEGMIAAQEAFLARGGIEDLDALRTHCARTGGAAGLLAVRLSGAPTPAALEHGLAWGAAMALVERLQDVGADARAGRVWVPRALLARHGVRAADLVRVPAPDGVRAALAELGAEARDAWRKALASAPRPARDGLGVGVVLGALHLALLDEMARDGWRLTERRVALTPLRKLWIAWRAARPLRRSPREPA